MPTQLLGQGQAWLSEGQVEKEWNGVEGSLDYDRFPESSGPSGA